MTKIEELEAKLTDDRENRRAFLKDATPRQILDWVMRSPDVEASTQAYCAKALIEADDRAAIQQQGGRE